MCRDVLVHPFDVGLTISCVLRPVDLDRLNNRLSQPSQVDMGGIRKSTHDELRSETQISENGPNRVQEMGPTCDGMSPYCACPRYYKVLKWWL